MNIIICGLQGTGKTTLSKQIAGEFGFKYINDYAICSRSVSEEKIIDFVKNNDNYVIDLCYSLEPAKCAQINNVVAYYLGFVSIDASLLFTLMKNKGENITLEEVEKNKKICKKMQQKCKKFNIPFYDVNKDRQEIIKEIINNLKSILK